MEKILIATNNYGKVKEIKEILDKYELLTFANDFIVESDFWKLWHNDQEYRNNHWYSGKQKEEAEKYGITKELRK